MSARLVGLRPMLEAPRMDEALAFWTDVLGFTVLARMDDEKGRPFWVQVERDGVKVMLTTHYHDDPSEDDDEDHVASFTGMLYIDVDDVDALAASLSSGGGVAFEYGPEDQPYGMREFGVRDPNGYLLVFGQPLGGG